MVICFFSLTPKAAAPLFGVGWLCLLCSLASLNAVLPKALQAQQLGTGKTLL
jgi:hypothetical protein